MPSPPIFCVYKIFFVLFNSWFLGLSSSSRTKRTNKKKFFFVHCLRICFIQRVLKAVFRLRSSILHIYGGAFNKKKFLHFSLYSYRFHSASYIFYYVLTHNFFFHSLCRTSRRTHEWKKSCILMLLSFKLFFRFWLLSLSLRFCLSRSRSQN